MDQIRIFSPATIANVSCGFDALGLALDALGDKMLFRKTLSKGIQISKIEGANLSFDIDKNVAGVVATAMLKKHPVTFGIEIEIYKNFKIISLNL
jgi:homoserine kinase